MKKNEISTKHYTKDGIRYKFNHVALDERIREQARFNNTTMGILQDHLAEKLNVSTDSIKGWKNGDNAPLDLIFVEDLAKCLNMDTSELLIPEQKGIFVNTQKMKSDRELIRRIFEECVSISYDFAERCDSTIVEECEDKIEGLHKTVDENALFCTSAVRYKLHKLLIECYQAVDFPALPNRWIEITHKTGNKKWNPFQFWHTHFLSAEFENYGEEIEAIDNEILLAENLGFDGIVQIPESSRKKAKRLDDVGMDYDEEFETELKEYGFQSNLERPKMGMGFGFDITPEILWKDTMVQTLREIFLNDFADIMED